MGRRKSIVKIEFQRAMYKSGWELLNRKKHKEPEKDFSSEEFCGLVCPLRNAVKKVGLKLTSGRILRKNNREFCEIMLFPKEVVCSSGKYFSVISMYPAQARLPFP